MAYSLEGRLFEVCTCKVPCPCWVGADPDGTCTGVLAWQIETGTIETVDVSGLTFAALLRHTDNILNDNWRIAVYLDDKATSQQQEALLNAWTGKLGGPLADLAQLIGEVAGVEQAPIALDMTEDGATLRIGQVVEADTELLRGPTGKRIKLHDSVFSTIPGDPAYRGRSKMYRVQARKYGFTVKDLPNHNSTQTRFRYTG